MARKVTLTTGQWADLPLKKLAPMLKEFGYDGAELACWGDHFDVEKAAKSKAYCDDQRALLAGHGLGCWAIANHLSGQLTCDNLDERHFALLPKNVKKDAASARAWAVRMQKLAAAAAKNMGVGVVNGFTGSPIWHLLYSFPPCLPRQIDDGFKFFAKTWKPILDVFADNGVKFALEVHPTEIAFDIASAERALDALDNHPAFGFNYDPSHLAHQGVDYVKFIRRFAARIHHAHM
ncbi:MAG: sugar phosphate isomerase/epimerase, partial [Kiritimatiellaeota bacterium]|nr:sugar phosphate isomerase/epimerase [Kiritimatiellota bacterium]